MPQLDARDLLDRCEQLLRRHDPATTPALAFLGAQFDAGLAWVHFPPGSGGLGVDRALQRVVDERLHAAGAPSCQELNLIGHGMAGPTLAHHGSADQRARYLRPLFTAEEVWCQLFSEPGAGSDVAGLATTATRDGDAWVVNGQKVWTSFGHLARRALLVARADPTVPKHQGLSYFVLDMTAPGVDVRPLYQMTGEAEFNEVYLTDVRIPDEDRLDAVGAGWRVVLTTLMNERVAVASMTLDPAEVTMAPALAAWREGYTRSAELDSIMRSWIEVEVLRLTTARAAAAMRTGSPGPEGSIGKLLAAQVLQRVAEVTVRQLGPSGTLMPGGYPMQPSLADLASPQRSLLRTRANSIEGGTNEIAKNIIGERVLGLPPEPRTDRDLPWREVPRN